MLPEEYTAKFIYFKTITNNVELFPYRKQKTSPGCSKMCLLRAWLTCDKIKSNFHSFADE